MIEIHGYEKLKPIPTWDGYYITKSGLVYTDRHGKMMSAFVHNCMLTVNLRKNGKTYQKTIKSLLKLTYNEN